MGVVFLAKFSASNIVWNPPGFQGKLPEARVSLRRNMCVFVFLGGLTSLTNKQIVNSIQTNMYGLAIHWIAINLAELYENRSV